jgi:hypothetical protein
VTIRHPLFPVQLTLKIPTVADRTMDLIERAADRELLSSRIAGSPDIDPGLTIEENEEHGQSDDNSGDQHISHRCRPG